MQAKTELAPRVGDWRDPSDDPPSLGENVLGYWYDCDCPSVRSVFRWEGGWFDSAEPEEEVDAPDAWAEVVYPPEGE
jgi:hypothetical protein